MEYDEARVYTALNADKLKAGIKVIIADDLACLKTCVKTASNIRILKRIEDESCDARFTDTTFNSWHLAYLISEPEEKKLLWADLNIGDVITNGRHVNMVTEIDKECEYNMHIYAGTRWLKDDELAEWEKVED